ncbi:MAG: hypothetical protein AB2784_17295 [Candidatus Thiodiazotropha endolucinida]
MAKLNLHYSRWQKIPRWLFKPKHFWLFAFGLLAASLLGDWLGYAWDICTTRQDRIRYSGWILDTLGLVSIAIGISSKLDRFEGKNLMACAVQNVLTWLGEFPLISQETIVRAKTANSNMRSFSARVHGTTKIDPNKPISEKLDWLLESYYTLVDMVHTLIENTEKKTTEIEKKIQELDANMSDNFERVKEETADVHIGDVGKEFVGLFWIFSGITFATVPEFIEAWFGLPISYFESLGRYVGLG